MVGLPGRGKSTIASKLRENLVKNSIKTRIFNSGDLRRKLSSENTSYPGFYDPRNRYGVELREKIALINIRGATDYLKGTGCVAILDATNVSLNRRKKIARLLTDHAILFIECINNDEEILKANIDRKVAHPEFNHLGKAAAIKSFQQRIKHYQTIYTPLRKKQILSDWIPCTIRSYRKRFQTISPIMIGSGIFWLLTPLRISSYTTRGNLF